MYRSTRYAAGGSQQRIGPESEEHGSRGSVAAGEVLHPDGETRYSALSPKLDSACPAASRRNRGSRSADITVQLQHREPDANSRTGAGVGRPGLGMLDAVDMVLNDRAPRGPYSASSSGVSQVRTPERTPPCATAAAPTLADRAQRRIRSVSR